MITDLAKRLGVRQCSAAFLLALKTIVIDWTCTLMNRNSNLVRWFEKHFPTNDEAPLYFRFYWWVEGILNHAFSWAFAGSREEAEDAVNLAYGDYIHCYNPRQRAIILSLYPVTQKLLPERCP